MNKKEPPPDPYKSIMSEENLSDVERAAYDTIDFIGKIVIFIAIIPFIILLSPLILYFWIKNTRKGKDEERLL